MRAMVIKARLRKIGLFLAFHAAAWGATAYFAHAAYTGDRGILAKRELKIRAFEINKDIATLKAESAAWQRRIGQLRAGDINRDLLDERARAVLNVVHANDLMLVLPETIKAAPAK